MELSGVFQDYIQERQEACSKRAEHAMVGEEAVYYDPGMADDAPTRFAADFSAVLSNDELNQVYTSERESGSSAAKLGVISLQHALVDAARRDYGFRRRTRVQARAAAVSRCFALGLENGPLLGSSLGYFKALMEAEDA